MAIKQIYKNKFIREVYFLIVDIILSPIIILCIIIKYIFRVQFLVIFSHKIGHLAMNTDTFIRRLRINKESKNLKYIFISSNKPANRQLLDMYKRVISVIEIPNWLYESIAFKTLYNKNSLIGMLKLFYRLPGGENFEDFNNEYINIGFTPEEEIIGKNGLRKMGIDSKFICFHSRDSLYHNDIISDGHRNFSINSLLKSMEYITKHGYFAIRVGAKASEKLKTTNPKIIDYTTKFRSDFMDIYLISHCEFLVSGDCGVTQIAQIFNKKLLWTNVVPYDMIPRTKRDKYLRKKYLLYNTLLNEDDIKAYNINYRSKEFFDKVRSGELTFENNTSQEIYEVVKIMVKKDDL